MTNLQEMQALQDAHRIIRSLAVEAASGTKAVWLILHHAQQHINNRMTDALGDTLQGHPWPFSGGPGAVPAPKCGCTISYPCALHSATSSVKDESPAVRCDQCAACMIQGVFCHETGCVNSNSRYDAESGEWVKQRKCFECGCTVDADDLCCNAEYDSVESCDDCGESLADCECGLDEDDDDSSLSASDILEFNGYLANCTDRQVQGVHEKESAAHRSAYVALAEAEAGRRGISL